MTTAASEHFAVIIGSGFAGLCMAITLKRAGIDDFIVLEKAGDIGGTWRDNVYPGCACDVPSHVYSFSFEPNPRWSSTYASQPEIRQYIEHCADKYDIRRHVRLRTEATSAELDERAGEWSVGTASGERFTARVVVGGLGPISRYTLPAIPGLARFEGQTLHSAGWDPSFDPRGKRIASIGTGASAIQFVPELAKHADRLHLFQRTPAWVLPRRERAYTELEKALFARVPGLGSLHRRALFWSLEAKGFGFVNDPRLLAWAERFAVANLYASVKDPALRAKLRPSYRMGCKRILMSNTYYPALARPNVEVVTGGIREVTPAGIVGNDGVERPVDAIVFGTGFDVHDYLGTLRCRGRGGRDLGALWASLGAQAYLGTCIAGFPNFFTIVGPNTGLGHNSIIYMIESQVAHVMRCIEALRAAPGASIEVREHVQRAYNESIQRRLAETVWSTGCKSWYLDAHGRNTTLWPGYCFQFRRATRRFDLADYQLGRLTA
jgi:cation diffusion facilitator CzcD-associated flavoprotein CzcO